MCRMIVRIGQESTSMDKVIWRGVHNLEVQSHKPKLMTEATMNVDGFGAAWYVPGHERPARYRTTKAMWADPNLHDMAYATESRMFLAYVRSATPGLGISLANTQPFIRERYAFMHNGYLKNFREGAMRKIQRNLSDEAYTLIRGSTDSEHLFALCVDALINGASKSEALMETTARARELVSDPSLVTLMLSDGEGVAVLRSEFHGGSAPTLFSHVADGETLLASEPFSEKQTFREVPIGSVLEFSAS